VRGQSPEWASSERPIARIKAAATRSVKKMTHVI
jgi:hypothetical protein